MPVFGSYETAGQLSPTPFGSVYRAKAAGSSAANFIIKTYSPLGVEGDELRRHPQVKRFLGSAELQKLVSASSKHWAPIHDLGFSPEGAYYVSTFYPTSASRLIKGKTKLGADDLFALTDAVLEGLVELKQLCRRSHGNLLASCILLPRMDASGYQEAMLAEPLAADSTQGASEQGDLAAMGRVLYELVMHKPYNVAGAWPIPDSPEWSRLGKGASAWREFCNKLLSTDPSDAMTLEQAQAHLSKLKPKKALVPMWAVVAAVLVLAIGGGLFVYFNTRPDPNFGREWNLLAEAHDSWFRIFTDKELSRRLSSHYAKQKKRIEEAEAQKLVVDPMEITGKVRLEEIKELAPKTRDAQNKARQVIGIATLIQAEVMGMVGANPPDALDAKALPEALRGRVEQLSAKYKERKWDGPAAEIRSLVESSPSSSKNDELVRLVQLLEALPLMETIEQDWKAVDGRLGQLKDERDPILTQIPQYVQRQVYSNSDDEPQITTADISRNLAKLKTEFEQPFWNELTQFVTTQWRSNTDQQKLRETSVYAVFKGPSPPELQKPHLETWLGEARNFVLLDEAQNPLRNIRSDNIDNIIRPRLSEVLAYYGAEPPDDVKKLANRLKGVDDELVNLRSLRWRAGTRDDMIRRVEQAIANIDQLRKEIDSALADTKRADPQGLDAIATRVKEQVFISAAANSRWKELRLKWSVDDKQKLLKTYPQKVDEIKFKQKVLTSEDNLRKIEKKLIEPFDILSTVQRNSTWNRALVDAIRRLDADEQRRRVGLVIGSIDDERLALATGVLPAKLEEAKDGYDTWRREARQFVADANLFEDHLDAGFGLVPDPKPIDDLFTRLSSTFGTIGDVKTAVAPLAGRYKALQSLKTETRPAELLQKVVGDDPALVLDAWQYLTADAVKWPVTPADFDEARKHVQLLPSRFQGKAKNPHAQDLAKQRQDLLMKDLATQAAVLWRKFVEAGRAEAEVATALKKALVEDARREFRIGDISKLNPPLSPAAQFNILLYNQKLKVPNLPAKLDDKEARQQVAMIKDALPPGDQRVIDDFRKRLEELLKETGGGAAAVEAGPMSAEAKKVGWEQSGNEEALTFKLGNHEVTFVRLEGVTGNGQKLSYYLSTTEVTVGLFGAMMQAAGATPVTLGLPDNDTMSSRGPQLWQVVGNGIQEADSWLKKYPQRFDDYPAALLEPAAAAPAAHLAGRRLAAAGHNPQTDMPMQYVPPEAAMFIAAQMGCRLPTYAEWKFAAAKQPFAPGFLPNLRDATWDLQLAHVTPIRAKRLIQLKWPDAGGFNLEIARGEGESAKSWSAALLSQAGIGGVPNPFNDQYLWLRPVKPGPVLSDLYGNVAELVFAEPIAFDKLPDKSFATLQKVAESNDKNILVVGGSCISPPEFGLDRQVIGLNGGFADTGFRLAFAASKRLVVERLKDVIHETKYVVLAGPTAAPAN